MLHRVQHSSFYRSEAVSRWASFAEEAALPESIAAALAAQFVSLE